MQKENKINTASHSTKEALASSEADIITTAAEVKTISKFPGGRLRQFTNKISRFRISDKSQKKTFSQILRFFAVVLLFTIIARGTASATLPRVDLGAPYSSEIINSVTITGTVEAAHSEALDMPPSLEIKSLMVTPGQQVKHGEALLCFDVDEVAEQLKREELKLAEMELTLSILLRSELYDGNAFTAANSTANKARQDLETAQANSQSMINKAQDELNKAKQFLADSQARYDLLINDSAVQDDEKNTALTEIETAKGAVIVAENMLSDAQKTAQAGVENAEQALEMAELNLSSAKISDSAARQTAADRQAQKQIDAENTRLNIEKQKKIIELYDAIADDGVLYSDKEGSVLSVAKQGDITGLGDVITIADTSLGFRISAMIPKESSEKLLAGSVAEIHSSNGYFDSAATGLATLLSVSEPDENNMLALIYSLDSDDWKHSQTISLEIIQNSQKYDFCVPLSAIRQDRNGTHILVTEESSGILGVEIIVRAIPVVLLADDGSTAAISGDIGFGRNIIYSSSKLISDGDKVRVNI